MMLKQVCLNPVHAWTDKKKGRNSMSELRNKYNLHLVTENIEQDLIIPIAGLLPQC